MRTHALPQALRVFRLEPALTAAAVLTLTLGIGANTALFAVVEAVLLRPLPFDRAEQLVVVRHRDVQTGLTKPDIAIGDFVDLRARQRSFEALAGFGGFQSTLFGGAEPLRIEGAVVTPDALRALRLQPALGRSLQDADARQGATPVVLVSHDLWRTSLGSDPRVLSRSIQIGTTRMLVAGVLPPGFRFPGMAVTDVVVTRSVPVAAPAQRRNGWIYGIGRLRPGVTLAAAEAELGTLSRQLEREFPAQNRGSRYEALNLRTALVGDTQGPLFLLLGAVGCVLLIACANVGNLLLARAIGRQQELAVRLALGASRARLARQVLGEALALAAVGGAAGVAFAGGVAPVLATLIPNAETIPGLERVGISVGVVLFSFAASVASALVFGAIACIVLVRAGSAVPGQRRGTLTPGAGIAASGLVVAEIALAVVLLGAAGLTVRSFANLLHVDPGFTSAGVLTVQFALPEGRYQGDEARQAVYARVFADLKALPEVETVGAAMVTPLTGNNWTTPLRRVERPVAAGQRPPEVGWQLASRGYFEALRIPLRKGRLFETGDAAGPPVVIISEAVAARHFPGEEPLGHRLDMGDMKPEIVGVVGNIRRASLTDDARADLYFPFERAPSPSITLFVRASGDPVAALPALRAVIRRLEPQAVLYETRTLARIAEESAGVNRLAARLLNGFAVIAVILAAVGVYSVTAYRVRRRTRELGTRLALGASRWHIVRLVLRQAGTIAVIGLGLGTAMTLVAARGLSSLLFGVRPWDPATLASAVAVLAAATLAASYLPARRAAAVDPTMALSAD
ncbi:MAG: ABC transporter permease [Vicinamibacteraceae bacterium]